jgi:predicted ATP-grasp superfamily ATP-dependent carboligase
LFIAKYTWIDAIGYLKCVGHRDLLFFKHVGANCGLFVFADVENAVVIIEHRILLFKNFYQNTWPKIMKSSDVVLRAVAEQIFFRGVAVKIEEKLYFFFFGLWVFWWSLSNRWFMDTKNVLFN